MPPLPTVAVTRSPTFGWFYKRKIPNAWRCCGALLRDV
jgi:hypothetical protein